MGDSEDFELVLVGLPTDIQTGIYQTSYNVSRAGDFSGSGGGAYVVIEAVADQQITGKFYFEGWDKFYYGQFIDVAIPLVSDCHIVGLPTDNTVSLSIDFIDETLDSYDLDEVNGYWFIETEPNRYGIREDSSQAELHLHFSSQDNADDGISLSIELRPAFGASVGIYQTDMENPNHINETSLNIHFKDRSRGINFNGSIIIGEFDEVLTGEFSGALIHYVDDDLYLTLGTISGSFNDLPIPASSCEDSSTS